MAAMEEKKQRAAIIVRQCPAAAEGYVRYQKCSANGPVHASSGASPWKRRKLLVARAGASMI
jgi:hypothetical protein